MKTTNQKEKEKDLNKICFHNFQKIAYYNKEGGYDMQDNIYEEYIRSVLGYPQNNIYQDNRNEQLEYISMSNINNTELETYYPEIYKVVYPMVCTACNNNREKISGQLIDELTNEIYFAIDENGSTTLDRNMDNNRQNNISKNQEIKKTNNLEKVENRTEDRQKNVVKNRTLHDLIKILIIRELLKRPNGRPNRPPMPPFPGGRPPYPPMRPRNLASEYDWYI